MAGNILIIAVKVNAKPLNKVYPTKNLSKVIFKKHQKLLGYIIVNRMCFV